MKINKSARNARRRLKRVAMVQAQSMDNSMLADPVEFTPSLKEARSAFQSMAAVVGRTAVVNKRSMDRVGMVLAKESYKSERRHMAEFRAKRSGLNTLKDTIESGMNEWEDQFVVHSDA